MRERRRDLRFKLSGRVLLEMAGKTQTFEVADISVSGVGVVLDTAVYGMKPTGMVGRCRIESPDLAATLEAFVSPMRVLYLGERYILGLRFESIADEYLRVIRAYEALALARKSR